MSSSIPLTSAVTSGDEKAVSALLANGADVNLRTGGGQTPLILAVVFGHTNIIRLLVGAGADPQQRDNLGLNAIDWAQRRGLTEVIDILTNPSATNAAPGKIRINIDEPEPPVSRATPKAPQPESRESVSEAEKSERWMAGFKQRLDEQAVRRLNRNDPPAPPRVGEEEPPPLMSVATRKAPESAEAIQPEVTDTKPAAPEPVKEPAEAKPAESEPVTALEPKPRTPPPEVTRAAHSSRILTPPPIQSPPVKRKRCPKCNAVYNGELVAYCAHHIVALVDDDEPLPSPPPRSNPPLFWIMVIITLTGSIVVGSLITTYLYKTNQAAARVAADQQVTIQKGVPEVGGELVGKSVLLPDAECPVKGPDPISGKVTVRVMVDKNGQVYWARGAGGDWLMRGAATEAAMKSSFAPEKLRGRETEGTITYTFKP